MFDLENKTHGMLTPPHLLLATGGEEKAEP